MRAPRAGRRVGERARSETEPIAHWRKP
jgi:hypothetical protein